MRYESAPALTGSVETLQAPAGHGARPHPGDTWQYEVDGEQKSSHTKM